MAHSPPRSGQPPIQQLQTVVDLLETPVLARMYAYILQHGPVTVSEIVDELDIPQGTAYDYIQNLETVGLVEKTRDQRPYEYDAESISLTLSTVRNADRIVVLNDGLYADLWRVQVDDLEALPDEFVQRTVSSTDD